MASDDIRALLAAVPPRPWRLDVREAPALDHDNALLRDAGGAAVCAISKVEIAELVARTVNEHQALIEVELRCRQLLVARDTMMLFIARDSLAALDAIRGRS